MLKPEDLFEKWYGQPLEKLKSIPNGDGGFIALATSCFLYERYAIAAIENSPHAKKATPQEKINQLMYDFGVDKDTAEAFWDVIRNGLLHGAMPKQKTRDKQTLPYWAFRHDFPLMELSDVNGKKVLKIQPWLVMEKVISLWRSNINLLDQNNSFPWGGIYLLPL